MATKIPFEVPVIAFKTIDGDTLDLLLDLGFGVRYQCTGVCRALMHPRRPRSPAAWFCRSPVAGQCRASRRPVAIPATGQVRAIARRTDLRRHPGAAE